MSDPIEAALTVTRDYYIADAKRVFRNLKRLPMEFESGDERDGLMAKAAFLYNQCLLNEWTSHYCAMIAGELPGLTAEVDEPIAVDMEKAE